MLDASRCRRTSDIPFHAGLVVCVAAGLLLLGYSWVFVATCYTLPYWALAAGLSYIFRAVAAGLSYILRLRTDYSLVYAQFGFRAPVRMLLPCTLKRRLSSLKQQFL
jgi:hypothetical protein